MTWLNTWHIHRAVRALERGGVVAYATEAVFGLGCDPEDELAVLRVLELKRRPAHKGLILIAADEAQLAPYVQPFTAEMRGRMAGSWPGPNTWVVPARPSLSRLVRGEHDTVAVRVSAHPQVQALCLAFGGALVSTSANRAGLRPARTPFAVRQAFGDELDYLLPGAVGAARKPTTIRDALSGAVLRPA
ncbi:MAG: Sua5/YciO/YrdC/YwlC family protein [Gammaproteobacteria bacterium]|nr:Sua5/YciO/YrdC/YwlC family protein [Gammaproteobacteria bacterium]